MTIEAQLADGRVLEFPDGTDPSVIQATVKRMLAPAPAPAPAPKAGFSLADTALGFGQGVIGAGKSLTDVFGANNAASEALGKGQDYLGQQMTAGRQAEIAARQAKIKAAEGTGFLNEIGAELGAIKDAPLQATAQALGSVVPYVATSVAGGLAKLLPATVRIINTIVGAAQGAGSIKGSIYDTVYAELVNKGIPEAKAKEQAELAQSYNSKNALDIAGGAALGAVGARTGVENQLIKGAGEKAPAKLLPRVGKAMLEEAPMEGGQGAQEKIAQNRALQKEGFDVPTFQGVAGRAAGDAALGALAAGAVGATQGPKAVEPTPFVPNKSPVVATQTTTVDGKLSVKTTRADGSQYVDGVQVTPPTPQAAPAPTAPAKPTYEELQSRLEALQTQPNSKVRNRQMKAIREQMAAIPEQAELPGTQVPQALEPEKDLRGKRVLPKAEQPAEGLRDVIGAELPATTEVLQDAGIAPTQKELEAAGQQTMDLGEVPMSAPITMADLEGLGGTSASISKANRQWLADNVVGKTPEEVITFAQQYPQLIPANRFVKTVLKNVAAANASKEYVDANTQPLEVQPTVRAGGRKRSVGVPVQPTSVAGAEADSAAPAGAPQEPSGQRLVSPEQPADTGNATEGTQPGALNEAPTDTAPAAPDEYVAPTYQQILDRTADEYFAAEEEKLAAAKAPITVVEAKTTRGDPLTGASTKVKLSDGSEHEISRQDTNSTAGLPGWHEVGKHVADHSYLGDTKTEAIQELIRRQERKAEAPKPAPKTAAPEVAPEVIAAELARQQEAAAVAARLAEQQAASAKAKAAPEQRRAEAAKRQEAEAEQRRQAPKEEVKPDDAAEIEALDAALNKYNNPENSKNITTLKQLATVIKGKAESKVASKAVRQHAQAMLDDQILDEHLSDNLASTENADERPLPEDVVVHIRAGSVTKALSALATTLKKGSLDYAVAQRLWKLLGDTDIKIVDNLKGDQGQAARGLAKSDGHLIRLDSKWGLNVETLLHESVHAASEHVLRQDPKSWTPQQAAAVDELKALWEAAKRDKTIELSKPAQEHLSEFITEAMTNKDLQVQLRAKPWKMKNAWEWFKRKMLEAIGVQHPKTMQDSVIAAMDTIFTAVPEYAHVYGPKSENFKKWFGNSEVVDESGQPLVVYHGTLGSFDTFKLSPDGALGAGIYLTPMADFANTYADTSNLSRPDAHRDEISGQNVMPVYASLQKPLVLDGKRDPMIEALVKLGMDTTKAENLVEKAYEENGYVGKQVMTRAKAQGYDGLMEYRDGKLMEIVAFSPNQVKSATGNTGAYDATKPSMLAMVAPSVESLVNGAGDLSTPERSMLTSFLDAFKPVPGLDYVTKFRTQTADIAATIENRLREKFDGKVRDSLGNFNPMGLYRQAQDYSKMMLQFLQTGSIEKEAATGLWKVVAKEGTRAPAKVYDLLADWSKTQGYSFEQGKKVASRILEGVRLDQMRASNYTGATDFALHKIDKTSNMSVDQQIDTMVAEYNSHPELKEMSKLMDEARIALVDHMVAVGRLTPEMGKEWKEVVGYVPFDRMEQFAENFSRIKRMGARGLAQVGKLPELKGSFERPVGDVFGNYMNTLGWMLRQVVHTDATVRTLNALQDIGYAKFYNTNPKSDHVVSAYVNGELKYWELPSKYDVMAFKDLNIPQARWIQNLGAFSNVLRATVTALPPFALKQVTDDVQRAIMTSGVKSPAALLRMALTNFPKLVYAEMKGIEHPLVKQFGAYGLSGEYDFQQSKPADSLLKDMGYSKRSKFGTLMHKLEGITRASDLAVRAAIYEQTLKESNNDTLLAQTRSREFINFRRRGASEAIGAMVTTIPFFNAYVQGMDVLYRAASGKEASASNGRALARRMFMTRALTVTFISSLYALGKSDDDEYKDMDLRTRDSNWIFPNGYKLSVPGEMGAIFKVIPERVAEYMRRQGTVEEQSAFEVVSSTLSYMYEQYLGRVNPIPQAIKPVLEAWSNKSFLTGRSLEGFHHGQMDPSMRRTEATSELAIAIAKFASDELKMEVSPILIDNTLRGYFGSTAAIVTATTDALLNPDKVDRPLHKWALFSNYMYDPIGTRKVTEFYEQRDESMRATVTLKELMRTDMDKAAAYAETHMDALALESAVQSTLSQLEQTRAYRKFLNSTEGAKSMPREEREAQLEEIKKMEVQLTGWVREARVALKST